MSDEPDRESIRLAMDEAWRDHQHTRDQTWKALQIEFFLVAAVVGVNWQIQSLAVTIASGAVFLFVVLCGMQIPVGHRNRVELLKFRHIMNCEEALRLHRDDLISCVKPPQRITLWDAFNPRKGNTALFILRMHLAIFGLGSFLLGYRLYTWGG